MVLGKYKWRRIFAPPVHAVLSLPISFANEVRRFPAGQFRLPLERIADKIDAGLFASDEHSLSQRATLITFAIRVGGAVLTYASQVLLARWMGESQYGVFAVVWVGAVVLGGMSCLGFQKAIVRFVPEYLEQNEQALLRGVLVGSRVQALAVAMLVGGAGLLGLWLLGDRVSSIYVAPLYLAAVSLPILAATEVQEGIARAFSWPGLSLWPTFVARPLLILAVMAGAILAGFPADAATAMGSVIVAILAALVGQFLVIEHRLRERLSGGAMRHDIIRWVKIALPIFVVEGLFGLMTNVDVLIAGYLLDPGEVAVYFAAARTMALVHFVYYSVRAGTAHRFSQFHASGDRARLLRLVAGAVRWTFWPSLFMATILAIVGGPLLSLFGPSFSAGYPVLLILAAGLLVRASIGPVESLLAMSNHQGACALVLMTAFAVSVILNLVLIPQFGIVGAAVATALGLAVEAAGLFLVAWQRLGVRSSIVFAGAEGRRSKANA